MKVCYCHTITSVSNLWPVRILQHKSEVNHPIGTARIAELSLGDCQRKVVKGVVENGLDWFSDPQPLLVYPGEDSTPVEEWIGKPVRPLLFLDASWRKSRRMLHENSCLRELPKLSFSAEYASRYLIRKTPQPGYLSTLEAIVYVLSILEEGEAPFRPLLQSMDYMIGRQIEYMGEGVFEKHFTHRI